MERLTVVYLQWVDPHSIDDWTHLDDLDNEPALVESIGFLVDETNNCICVAVNYQHLEGEEKGHASCTMVIPKAAIKERRQMSLPSVLSKTSRYKKK